MSDVTWLVKEVLGGLADGRHLLLLTDYDGTLTPIVPDPNEARLSEAVRDDLKTLVGSPRVCVGIVSGRDLADLKAQVGVPGAIYAGCYGLEIEGPGMRFRHPDAEAQEEVLVALTQQLSRRAPAVPGMRVEPKRFGLAVHYRHVAPEQVSLVEMEMARAMPLDGSRLKIFHGVKVIEVQPQVGWTKGDSVLWIRDAVRGATGGQLMVLYMGDDSTDEHAFEALVAQAITIRVGDGVPASRAAYRVPDVAHVQQLLSALAARAGAGGGA